MNENKLIGKSRNRLNLALDLLIEYLIDSVQEDISTEQPNHFRNVSKNIDLNLLEHSQSQTVTVQK